MKPDQDVDACPECGAKMLSKRQGMSLSLRCSVCDWMVATTYPHPLLCDQTSYSVFVTSLGDDPSRSLIALNRRFNHGIAQTRVLFSNGEHLLMRGAAQNVWNEVHKLRADGVLFRIEPIFPHDLDDPKMAFDYGDDWTMV